MTHDESRVHVARLLCLGQGRNPTRMVNAVPAWYHFLPEADTALRIIEMTETATDLAHEIVVVIPALRAYATRLAPHVDPDLFVQRTLERAIDMVQTCPLRQGLRGWLGEQMRNAAAEEPALDLPPGRDD